jgi:hypothetical protein
MRGSQQLHDAEQQRGIQGHLQDAHSPARGRAAAALCPAPIGLPPSPPSPAAASRDLRDRRPVPCEALGRAGARQRPGGAHPRPECCSWPAAPPSALLGAVEARAGLPRSLRPALECFRAGACPVQVSRSQAAGQRSRASRQRQSQDRLLPRPVHYQPPPHSGRVQLSSRPAESQRARAPAAAAVQGGAGPPDRRHHWAAVAARARSGLRGQVGPARQHEAPQLLAPPRGHAPDGQERRLGQPAAVKLWALAGRTRSALLAAG